MSNPNVFSDVVLDRQNFSALLRNLQPRTFVVVKIGAEWCRPCRQIAPRVGAHVGSLPPNVFVYLVDADESDDLFGYLRSKKVISGIPALLLYSSSDVPIAPSEVCCGSDETAVDHFFATVRGMAER